MLDHAVDLLMSQYYRICFKSYTVQIVSTILHELPDVWLFYQADPIYIVPLTYTSKVSETILLQKQL